ncbi:hypothetical protein B0H11DRAFT_1934487 [Mycena galericulata]|nr:hypothetical protein B0H11DRAFT_1934487 [Mycena galericulata]
MQHKRYMNLGQPTPISVSPWLHSLICTQPDDGHQEPTLAEMNTLATSEDHVIEEPSSTTQLTIAGFVYSAELLNVPHFCRTCQALAYIAWWLLRAGWNILESKWRHFTGADDGEMVRELVRRFVRDSLKKNAYEEEHAE